MTRDGFHPVGKSRDLVESSVVYYPVAHSRNFDEDIRQFWKATSHSPRLNTNQSVTVKQRTTVITQQ